MSGFYFPDIGPRMFIYHWNVHWLPRRTGSMPLWERLLNDLNRSSDIQDFDRSSPKVPSRILLFAGVWYSDTSRFTIAGCAQPPPPSNVQHAAAFH